MGNQTKTSSEMTDFPIVGQMSPQKITDPVPYRIEQRVNEAWVKHSNENSFTQAVTLLKKFQTPNTRMDWRLVRIGNVVV